jgi:carbonic anhydrase/acetyltransferase-like protein (isoleucine patch superfamily)
MNATILDNAEIGEGAFIAGGALVLQNTKVGPHELWGGVPAKFIKMARPGMAEAFAAHYVDYGKEYLEADQKEG